MIDLQIPPQLLAYLPYLAVCLAVFAFVAISMPLAKKPIAGTTLRRQSIIALLAGIAATYHEGMAGWELLLIAIVASGFIGVYYRNHLGRKRIAEAIAEEKAKARKAELASFLEEIGNDD